MMVKLMFIAAVLFVLGGCVSNQAVQTVQPGDFDKSCKALQYELTQMGAKFDEVKDDSGFTGKNVGLALVFWPGVIVNEVRSNKNQDSVSDRVNHLSNLYQQKCMKDDGDDS